MLAENTFPLPSLPNLGVDPSWIPADLNPKQIVDGWFSSFQEQVANANVDKLISLFVPDAYWRDILALTWNLRTFASVQKIRIFLQDRLAGANLKGLVLIHEEFIMHAQPAPDLQWIQFFFKFEVGEVGSGMGIVRLVPVAAGNNSVAWKAHVVLTTLEDLKGFPEMVGSHRKTEIYAANRNWVEERANETAFKDKDPVVLVVGGAQSGLGVAARLKMLNVSCLVVEKGDRIGGNWIDRYSSLRLHDPVWYDHMPYLPFPENWPVFSPASKLANWLQYYAEALELDVWTKSTVTKATRDPNTNLWNVVVTTRNTDANGLKTETQRVFHVKHVIFATGLVPGEPKLPTYPGMDHFKGEVIHGYRFKTAANYIGKKVVVVGACTSAHDISADCYHHGVDVTMYQRSSTYVMSTKNGFKVLMGGLYEENGPPTDIADRIGASFPNAMVIPLAQRQAKMIAELDKDLLDGLHKRGFRTNQGYMDAGFILLAWSKAGGYYLDTGASQLIIDEKIKLKSDSPIEGFVENGIKFEDGSVLSADVVIFATGVGDLRSEMTRIVGDLGAELKPVWGLDDEGELRGVYRDMGMPGIWSMMGNLAMSRFHSKHIALQIKAMEENLFGERYN